MSFERRKIREGKVISDKMEKTVVVEVGRRLAHPLYGKPVRRRSKFTAHDQEGLCQMGDLVRIIESRPLSKTKRWRVSKILHREETAEIQPEEISVDDIVIKSDRVSPSVEGGKAPSSDTAVDKASQGIEEAESDHDKKNGRSG
jgi:small subunit ribosomal protein S17